MPASKIPEEIKKYRPGTCTEIKLISGHYYVYSYKSVKLPSGRWGKKTGKCIGTIIPDKGFCPNKNYKDGNDDDITILEYGQYALVSEICASVKDDLEACFPIDRASQMFAYAVILYVNNFAHTDQIRRYYEQSWLSLEYKDFAFKMGKTAINTVLDDLGRRTRRVKIYEQHLLDNSTSEVAIDGHAIGSCSAENDLSEAGFKFSYLKEEQVNLLMGYDVNTGMPLFSRIFRGSCNDKTAVQDLMELLNYKDILFIVDRGFYSQKNIELFSSNGNTYIVPLPSNTNTFKELTAKIKYTGSFYYQSGKKHSRIQYRRNRISDTETVYIFRDVEENEKCRYNYTHCMELGRPGYTPEGLEAQKENFGVYVLQTNSKMKSKQVFEAYKKRWGIETFYQYLKNKGDFNNLMIQDYYREQGFAFMMLITGQIHQKMNDALKLLNDNTISIYDILLMARCMKIEHRGNFWTLKNTRKRDLEILKSLGFQPKQSIPA